MFKAGLSKMRAFQLLTGSFRKYFFVAASEKMTDPAVPPVKVDGVAYHQPVHPPAQIGASGLSNEMKMIAHENKGQHRHLIPRRGALQ
jgi:hypothetical protein